MARSVLLWLLGVPIPIIILLWLFSALICTDRFCAQHDARTIQSRLCSSHSTPTMIASVIAVTTARGPAHAMAEPPQSAQHMMDRNDDIEPHDVPVRILPAL